ncbi:MAG: hypothetical protein IS860_11070 [Nitrosopumilus sp.]|nr:hypothetical protein [Nitrosopumilus sp.]
MKKTLFFLMISAVAVIGFVASGINYSEVTSQEQEQVLQQAFAANPYDCSMDEIDISAVTTEHKIPQTIPEGYNIYDSFTNTGEVGLFYATDEMCGPNATKKSFADGVIMFYTANEDSGDSIIADVDRHFNEYKNNSDYPDRITITQLAGHTAMVWDSGIEKNIYYLENGEIFAEDDSPYPAQITLVDQKNHEVYVVKGFVSLDMLENMLKSAIASKTP